MTMTVSDTATSTPTSAATSATMVERYARDGFVIVPGVLSEAEVAATRRACHERLQEIGRQEMLPADFLAAPAVWDAIFRPRMAEAVRAVLGDDAVLYPNLTVRKSLYIGWHVDEAFAGANREYVWAPGFAHLQGAIYLQDNAADTGGGIDVVPGSHLMSADGYGRVAPDFETGLAALAPGQQPIRVDGKAGDLVLWHARAWHRSTQPQNGTNGAADGTEEKLGLFFSAGRRDAYENNRFLSHLVTKQIQKDDGRNVKFGRHAQILDIRYPDSFPADVRARLDELDLGVASYGTF